MNTKVQTISIEKAPIALATLDKNLCFLNFSDAWHEEFNLKDKNILGQPIHEVIPNTPPEFINLLNNCLASGNKQEEEIRHICPGGSSLWYKWHITPWKEEDNSTAGLIMTCQNTTISKRAKELLRDAENVAKMGGWDLDLITNTVYWSNITKLIHEVPLDYEPNLETGINFYKEGESRETITRLVHNAIMYGEPWDTELQLITAKGREIWVRTKGKAEFINGKCTRVFGLFQDIDKQKKAEIESAQIQERLDLATSVAQIGIWEYNVHKDVLEWNEQMYPLYGVKKEDFIGVYETWKACVHPDDQDRCQKEFDMALAGIQDFKTQFRIIHPDGSIKYIRANAGLFKDADGNITKMVGTNWDITDQVNAQLRLDINKESFKGSFESSAVGMALVAKDGSWMDVNNSLCISLGYTRNELLNLTFQDITHPEDIDNDLNHLQPLLDGTGDSYQIEKRYFHKTGRIVYVVLTVTAVKDIDKNLSHFISQIMDITPRIEAKKKSEQFLDITKNQNNSLLNFAHIVSHNLRSHSSNLTMLSNYLLQEEEENERKIIERMIYDASDSLHETVEHLNEVVQITTGAKEQMREVNLSNTIINVEKNISALLSEKNVECDIAVDPEHKVKAVPAYLDSVLLNLFTNSIKYSSPHRKPKITVSSKKMGKRIIMDFKDNGQGINMKRHGEKLFGMYKTFHQHEDAKGIGLFITKNQIEAMDGKIEVESAVDKGTTFRVTLSAE